MKTPNTRALAAQSVARVLRGRSLDDVLAAPEVARVPDAPFLKALVYGVLREHSVLAWIASRLLNQPLGEDPDLSALIACGLHQLRSMDLAPHAAVSETVTAAAALKREKAGGLVNAVLRRYQRERADLEAHIPADPSVRFSHPQWLVDAVRRDWPERWVEVLAADNLQGPLVLRVNRRALPREAYLQRLDEMKIGARAVEHTDDGVVLEQARPAERIPGFNGGQVSVQDASAQLAASLLGARDGERVLDACAAPGGKTAQLLETAAPQVLALDVDGHRLLRVDENLRRLKLSAELVAGDGREPARWWDRKPFDRILVDAPCSGTGVIRRHPDIKWLRRDTDIPAMATTQLQLLRALWPLLKPGGTLVYATCSLLRAEGDEVVKKFSLLAEGVRIDKLDLPWGEATEHGRRIAPGGAFDGFYYCRMNKAS